MMDVKIDQIQCFQAVIETGSFTKASEKLNKAKSAIRYSINNLEKQLGIKLLDRNSYRPILTLQGESFLFRAKKFLEEYEGLQLYCEQISSQVEMKLTLSVSGICSMTKLYPVFKSVFENFPHTEFRVEREILSGEKMLEKKMVDLAIFEDLRDRASVEYKKIDTIRLISVISNLHPFCDLPKDKQTLKELISYPQIFQRSTLFDEQTRGGSDSVIKWKVTDTPSKKDFILNGLGWGRLPEHMILNEMDSKQLKSLSSIVNDEVCDIYLCRRKDSQVGKVSRFIWDSF